MQGGRERGEERGGVKCQAGAGLTKLLFANRTPEGGGKGRGGGGRKEEGVQSINEWVG